MHWLKNTLLYAGEGQEGYNRVKTELKESNRKSLLAFSMIAFFAMAVMTVSSCLDPALAVNRTAYLLSAVVCLLLWGVGLATRRVPNLIYVGIYGFLAVLFAFGIALGTFIEPNEMTVSFMILLFVAPLLFVDRPVRMSAAVLAGIVAYTAAARMTQQEVMFQKNMVDACMYGALSIVVSTEMMRIKVKRVVLEQENSYLSRWDVLTGMMNRRSFDETLAEIRKYGQDRLLLCAFDVNGLKKTNDTLGHAAGDELLQGAAECIRRVFGPYGSCFRTGGDEFFAVLYRENPGMEALLDSFRRETERWNGKQVHSLSVSVGIVPMKHGDNLGELLTQADMEMYASKTAYYRQIGKI